MWIIHNGWLVSHGCEPRRTGVRFDLKLRIPKINRIKIYDNLN
jgi:hypothetical protein